MQPRLLILSSASTAAPAKFFGSLAQTLGLQAEVFPICGELVEPPEALSAASPGGHVLLLHSTALAGLSRQPWSAHALEKTSFILVYGFTADSQDSPELKWLTRDAISSVTSLAAGPKQFTVHADVTHAHFPVSGRSWTEASDRIPVFSGAPADAGIQTYISANGHPLFVSFRRGDTMVFLLTAADWVDLEAPATPDATLRPWYAQLVAGSIFLRAGFGDYCWNSPISGATFIVDDPYLQERYGFVHFQTLLGELERTRSALAIAFIPYNFRRTRSETALALGACKNRFSIAIHGCDHTRAEFASADGQWLRGTVACALDRMEAHARRTGMDFDNVMVFPQGRFSSEAIGALRTNRVEAAVNTTACPVDCGDNPMTLRDHLEVAVTRYESFPIFVRRYPRDTFDFAFDALFQKPVLIVEHHEYFKHGYRSFADFIQQINALGRKIAWMPLGKTVRSSCLIRRTAEREFVLRHFAQTLDFTNASANEATYSCEKPEMDEGVAGVSVNGSDVSFGVHSGMLRYVAHLPAGGDMRVKISYRNVPRIKRRASLQHRLTTVTRRRLCDLRDNVLARNEYLLIGVQKMRKILSGR